MPELRALIVDDEPLARERLRLLLAEAGGLAVVGEASDGASALEQIAALAPDVVFLDIEMPGLGGFDVVELLDVARRPAVVFVTAFDAYAVRAFDVHAVDYLTKPVRAARLRETLARLQADRSAAGRRLDAFLDADWADAERLAEPPLERVTLAAGRRLRVVPVRDIARFEALDKVTVAVPVRAPDATGARLHPTVDFTLDALGARLPGFLRVHRAHLVNADVVRELVPWFSGTYRVRLAGGDEVPLARRRVAAVRALLGG